MSDTSIRSETTAGPPPGTVRPLPPGPARPASRPPTTSAVPDTPAWSWSGTSGWATSGGTGTTPWSSTRLPVATSFRGWPSPAPPRSFPTADQLADYFETYVRDLDLRVDCGVDVTSVDQQDDGSLGFPSTAPVCSGLSSYFRCKGTTGLVEMTSLDPHQGARPRRRGRPLLDATSGRGALGQDVVPGEPQDTEGDPAADAVDVHRDLLGERARREHPRPAPGRARARCRHRTGPPHHEDRSREQLRRVAVVAAVQLSHPRVDQRVDLGHPRWVSPPVATTTFSARYAPSLVETRQLPSSCWSTDVTSTPQSTLRSRSRT